MSSKTQARERMNRWFQPQEGIAREVISADIQRYLGRDALVRPGANEGVEGYWITAYRNLTTEMVRDLQQDSLRWRAEQQGHSSRRAPEYTSSQTHQSRQYYGPTETPAPTRDSQYPPPAADPYGSRDPYGAQTVRTTGGYNAQVPAGYPATSGYAQAPVYAQNPTGYADLSFQSPQSQFSQPSYASSNAGTYATGPSSYANSSPQHQYGGPQAGSQYVTSTTPQAYDAAQIPRTAAGYEGYQQPPDPRAATAADPYAGYRTGQPAAAQPYGYQQGVPANSSRENMYNPGHATAPPQTSSTSQYYADSYGRAAKPAAAEAASSSKRRHESGHHSSSHRRR